MSYMSEAEGRLRTLLKPRITNKEDLVVVIHVLKQELLQSYRNGQDASARKRPKDARA